MSSSPPVESSALRRWLTGWSLRARLVAAVVALLAVVCVLIGAATTIALRHSLIKQLDQQLNTVAGRAGGLLNGPPNGRPPGVPSGSGKPFGPAEPFPRGQPIGTLTGVVENGEVEWAVTLPADTSTEREPVPAAQEPTLAGLPADGEPRTRALGDLGDYRLVAREMPDGEVIVTGLPLTDLEQTIWQMIGMEAGIAAGGLLLAGTAGALIVRASLRPLRRVAATAGRVAELPLDRGEVALGVRVPAADTDQRTEVGQVGAALNRMLGHVAAALAARQASETRVRQFVADASHELRTPLAAIRGYAELTRRGRDPVPPDIAHALRRIESEGTRMTALVDDLLLLARLDAGRPLAVEPVDLSALAVDAVSDAHVAGPDHNWRLDLPDRAVCVDGDPARLHQILANLLTNARTHTPSGTTVTTSLAEVGPEAVALTVLDDGPGIPPALQADVFERFARGDTSRSRTVGGTGLGLAIVAAVVEAHRGTVTLTSRPGRTALTVRLPRLTADT
ncbi:HAMP domain-containing histidine kinase [Micromonospora sp. NBC_01699]|uniref:HAMP domain-containing sensor histidine kinase n=1 Tax=Micromonospora sp. NBC_01699 TaxID=2975984 RepID=UPI002E33261E|nr:HAMP domain-containing sensor histidine kinase [Micromonospora sp. NBC_01699]